MDKPVDVDELVAEINRRLISEQQIEKDDPMYTGIVINKVALDTYAQHSQMKLDESLQQFLKQLAAVIDPLTTQLKELSTKSEEQNQLLAKAEAVAENMILKGANTVQKQLDASTSNCEQHIKSVAQEEKTKLYYSYNLIFVGACLVLITGIFVLGNALINWYVDLNNYQKTHIASHHPVKKAAH